MSVRDINVDPNILGGLPVFSGTRVPIQALFDCLEGGDSLDDFLTNYPDVTREQAVRVLEASRTSRHSVGFRLAWSSYVRAQTGFAT